MRTGIAGTSWGRIVEGLFETFVENRLEQPTIVIDYPRETSPLCKVHRSDDRLIERFEPFVLGTEIGNAYSEQNDSTAQRQLLEQQSAEAADGETTIDEEFYRALELGMPPSGGLGLGIDRLVMFVTGRSHIRDVILFPLT